AQRPGADGCDVPGRDLREGEVGGECSSVDALRLDQPESREMVLEEVSRAQRQHVHAGHLPQSLLLAMQTDDWPRALGEMRADAAEADDIPNAARDQRRGGGLPDFVLIGPEVGRRHVRRNERVHRVGSAERLDQIRLVRRVADYRLGAAWYQRFQILPAAREHANLLAVSQQNLRN